MSSIEDILELWISNDSNLYHALKDSEDMQEEFLELMEISSDLPAQILTDMINSADWRRIGHIVFSE